MKLTQLRYFVTICKYNNFTHASNELHISQPSLSNAIKELEEEFGVSLFYRLSKGIVLTEEGEHLFKEATELLTQSDNLVSHMTAFGKEKHDVTLGVPPMSSTLIFPHLLQAFCDSFPNSKMKMFENGTLTNKNMVLDGTLDAAIISSETRELKSSFDCCDLMSLGIYFYVSNKHPLASRVNISLSDLSDSPIAMLADDSFLSDFLYQRFKALNITPNIIVKTNQLKTIQKLIENNTAAALLFENTLDMDKSIAKLPVIGLPTIQIRLIWNKNKKISVGTQNLIRLAQATFK